MVSKKKTWLTPFIEKYYQVPHRIMPPFDVAQYVRPLSKAKKLLGERESLRRWFIFCNYSNYLHAATFLKTLEDWK